MKTQSIIKQPKILISVKAFLLATIFAAFAANAAAQKAADNFAHLKTERAAILKKHIGKQKNLRPAQITDCKNKFGLDSLRQNAGKRAHPYYAAADFNQDKITDFAVVLSDSTKKTDARFTLLIFNGSKSGGYKLASTNAGMDLRQGGIWTDGFGKDETKRSVTAGVFETDDCIWLEWENGKYVARDCSEAEN